MRRGGEGGLRRVMGDGSEGRRGVIRRRVSGEEE